MRREEEARGGAVKEAEARMALPRHSMVALATGERLFIRVLVDDRGSRTVAVSMAVITGVTVGATEEAMDTATVTDADTAVG
ncbi:MAG: hypothetical protein ABSA12_13450 [Verrucomicrobiia bacterium]|jgi:hypothetical protein